MSLQVTIGTAPCSWGVWWPDGTPSGTPYNVFLDQAAEAGYKALELGPVGYLPTDIGQLLRPGDPPGPGLHPPAPPGCHHHRRRRGPLQVPPVR